MTFPGGIGRSIAGESIKGLFSVFTTGFADESVDCLMRAVSVSRGAEGADAGIPLATRAGEATSIGAADAFTDGRAGKEILGTSGE